MAWTQVPFRGPVQLRRFLDDRMEEEAWQAVGTPAQRSRWQGWAEAMAHETRSTGASVVSWEQPDYPRALAEIHDAPPVLYAQGDLTAWHHPMVAVVGTRQCSDGAARWSFQMGQALAQSGITLVTGGAHGVDIAAVQGALHAGGRVIWCLAEGLDCISPRAHRKWAEASLGRGAWITEYPLRTAARPWRFAHRNRIVVGMGFATVLVQSPADGGGMISARLALSYNRTLGVLPPLEPGPAWDGNRHWLATCPGAGISEVGDWLAALGFQTRKVEPSSLPEALRPLWRALLGSRGRTASDLSEQLGLTDSQVLHQLLLLELQGRVRSVPGGRYVALQVLG